MGRKLVVAAIATALGVAAPAFLPDAGKASAQIGSCRCYAAFDAIDSDLRNLGRRYESTSVAATGSGCVSACTAWRRDWFTRIACDNPTRINRGTTAMLGAETGPVDTFVGPDTWWCPFPPP
jgi:hypothetical protein